MVIIRNFDDNDRKKIIGKSNWENTTAIVRTFIKHWNLMLSLLFILFFSLYKKKSADKRKRETEREKKKWRKRQRERGNREGEGCVWSATNLWRIRSEQKFFFTLYKKRRERKEEREMETEAKSGGEKGRGIVFPVIRKLICKELEME